MNFISLQYFLYLDKLLGTLVERLSVPGADSQSRCQAGPKPRWQASEAPGGHLPGLNGRARVRARHRVSPTAIAGVVVLYWTRERRQTARN